MGPGNPYKNTIRKPCTLADRIKILFVNHVCYRGRQTETQICKSRTQ